MTTKTNKSYQKRLRITRTGKVLKRKSGQNHFNARVRRAKQLDLKRQNNLVVDRKELARYLPHN